MVSPGHFWLFVEGKKMIANSVIQRVNVFKGYRLEIEFNFDLRQFFAELDKAPPKNISHNKNARQSE